jgi:hypothetical protein
LAVGSVVAPVGAAVEPVAFTTTVFAGYVPDPAMAVRTPPVTLIVVPSGFAQPICALVAVVQDSVPAVFVRVELSAFTTPRDPVVAAATFTACVGKLPDTVVFVPAVNPGLPVPVPPFATGKVPLTPVASGKPVALPNVMTGPLDNTAFPEPVVAAVAAPPNAVPFVLVQVSTPAFDNVQSPDTVSALGAALDPTKIWPDASEMPSNRLAPALYCTEYVVPPGFPPPPPPPEIAVQFAASAANVARLVPNVFRAYSTPL